jgi:hypothetical protein
MNNFSCIDEFVTTGLDILVNPNERAKVDTGAALGSFFLGVPRCRRCNASSDVSVFARQRQTSAAPKGEADYRSLGFHPGKMISTVDAQSY